MGSPYLAGIDLGTSSLKAVIVDTDGTLLAMAQEYYGIDTPALGWAEQDVHGWLVAAVRALSQVADQAGIEQSELAAIGLSSQSHGVICLDAVGDALRPAIIWADQRSAKEVAEIQERVGKAKLAAWTGNPLAAGFMLPSWLWLQSHEPEMAAKTKQLLLPKDYLRYRLTNTVGAEPSDAGTSGLFDPITSRWSSDLLSALDIDASLLAPVSASDAIAGGLDHEIARQTGLASGTPVIFGAADQACQALGNGILDPGNVSSTIGTGGQLLAPTLVPAVDPELRLHLYNHIVPHLWWSMGAILSAGLSMTWLRDNILLDISYQEMADLAMDAQAGSEGLYFAPYLAGERTPHMDASARGGFVGLTLRHGRSHMCRAVMEGVVFAMRQGLEIMLELGIPVERVIASGGGTRHALWLQLQADIFNCSIQLTRTVEAAAVGAALLAGIGVGVYENAAEVVARTVRWSDTTVTADPKRVDVYNQAYEHFCQLYPALRCVTR